MKRQVELAKERGALSWLSVLPLSDQGFLLHKGEFRCPMPICYSWTLPNTPNLCNCGKAFFKDHAMVWHMGGFTTIHHNEIRDITASLLTEVCYNVAIEPCLQPLSGEYLNIASANTTDGVRLSVRARVSGMFVRMHTLMYGFFTQMLQATEPEACLQYTRGMKMRRREPTINVYGT